MLLICGASGLVGKELCLYFDKHNISYIGTYNSNKIDRPNYYKLDFNNILSLENFLNEHKITCCIFCIVERLTDKCENNWNEIKKTNIDLVHITSYLCNKYNIKFIHLSTDYVFDGSNQPNFPNSEKNPLQNYGISKLISEYRVKKNCKNYCIIRTPVLYSSASKIHDNAVCLIGKNIMDLRTNKIFKEDNYSIRRPLYIKDMCNFIHDCITKDYIGLYHFYNPINKFTKYDICKIIGQVLNLPISKIVPNNLLSEGIAPRPYDTQLIDDKFDISKYSFTDFHNTINLCFEKFICPKINIENNKDIFILLDLDGTIINTNLAHYNAYKKTFKNRQMEFLDYEEWNNFIMNKNIDDYLREKFDEKIFYEIKTEKFHNLNDEEISFTNNSETFLQLLINNNFNFCVVTNTNQNTSNLFKQKLPLLNKIKNWIYRDNYNLPKPNSECFYLAKENFYKNEKYIIGIEDSMVGFSSLKEVTDLIFIYNNDDVFKNNDCYIFNDFTQIM